MNEVIMGFDIGNKNCVQKFDEETLCKKYKLSTPRMEWLNTVKVGDFRERDCEIGRNEQAED
jgi:hypothetical protein